MALTIRISPDAEARLLGLATAAGRSTPEFAASLIERAVAISQCQRIARAFSSASGPERNDK